MSVWPLGRNGEIYEDKASIQKGANVKECEITVHSGNNVNLLNRSYLFNKPLIYNNITLNQTQFNIFLCILLKIFSQDTSYKKYFFNKLYNTIKFLMFEWYCVCGGENVGFLFFGSRIYLIYIKCGVFIWKIGLILLNFWKFDKNYII